MKIEQGAYDVLAALGSTTSSEEARRRLSRYDAQLIRRVYTDLKRAHPYLVAASRVLEIRMAQRSNN